MQLQVRAVLKQVLQGGQDPNTSYTSRTCLTLICVHLCVNLHSQPQVRAELEQVLQGGQDPGAPRNDLPLCNLAASMLPAEPWKVGGTCVFIYVCIFACVCSGRQLLCLCSCSVLCEGGTP